MIDAFLSHSWRASAFAKQVALCLYYRWKPSLLLLLLLLIIIMVIVLILLIMLLLLLLLIILLLLLIIVIIIIVLQVEAQPSRRARGGTAGPPGVPDDIYIYIYI